MKFPQDYITLQFKDGGRTRPNVDCWGLVCLVYKEQLGIELPHYGEIGAKELLSIARTVNANVIGDDWEKTTSPNVFDVVVMSAHDRVNGKISRVNAHVGIMVDERKVLHIEDGAGACIVDIQSPMLKNRVVGVYEYAG